MGRFLIKICLIQILTGLLISLNFNPRVYNFWSFISKTEEINIIKLLRWFHLNGASIFFLIIFMHMGRGIYYKSFLKTVIWVSGIILYILLIAVAFLGYILPWGQISLWGGTVITNLFSVLGIKLVLWMWGGFRVYESTLNTFFTLHFLLPFILFIMSCFHIIILHTSGSSSKIFISPTKNKFGDFYFLKDLNNLIFILLFFIFIFLSPWKMGDPENFIEANNMISPIHIKPEWYFLWAYAILRAIPSKSGGVIILLIRIVILLLILFKQNNLFRNKFIYIIVVIIILLTILGGCPVEAPFILISIIFSSLYFIYFILF